MFTIQTLGVLRSCKFSCFYVTGTSKELTDSELLTISPRVNDTREQSDLAYELGIKSVVVSTITAKRRYDISETSSTYHLHERRKTTENEREAYKKFDETAIKI